MKSFAFYRAALLIYGLLFALIAAKLSGLIDLSWIWVTAPFWLPSLVLFLGLTVFLKALDRWLKS